MNQRKEGPADRDQRLFRISRSTSLQLTFYLTEASNALISLFIPISQHAKFIWKATVESFISNYKQNLPCICTPFINLDLVARV